MSKVPQFDEHKQHLYTNKVFPNWLLGLYKWRPIDKAVSLKITIYTRDVSGTSVDPYAEALSEMVSVDVWLLKSHS